MEIRSRFADLMEEVNPPLNLSAVPRGPSKANALADMYSVTLPKTKVKALRKPYRGCFLTTDEDELGRAARWYRDEFRDIVSKNNYQFKDVSYDRLSKLILDSTNEGYLASKDAFETYARDQASEHERWLFRCLQNSGCCVGSSGVEMLHGILGTRAADSSFNEIFKYLMAMWAYMFRGHCGGGWYMSAHASVTIKYGYAFATFYNLPDLGKLDYDGENDSEKLTTSTWCRRQPDDFIAYVASQKWFFDSGAITEFNSRDGLEAIKDIIRARGQLHHGSNQTSGSSTPNVITSIGGHAQVMQGGFWDAKTLEFYEKLGIKYTNGDFPTIHHQTWGPGWRGEVADKFWPEWFGPKPEGAWICSAKQVLKYFSDGYVYLPLLKGIPSETPPVPPSPPVPPVPPVPPYPIVEHPDFVGNLTTDIPTSIRGILTLDATKEIKPDKYQYLIEPVPGQPGVYRPTPKIV